MPPPPLQSPFPSLAAAARSITSAPAYTARPAFSLIEIIVVVIILGLLGGLIMPRLINLGGRQTTADAHAVAEILAIAARRDDQTNQPVAIDYDAQRGSISLLVFAVQPDGSDRKQWRTDRLAPAALLRGSEVESVFVDGNSLSTARWRIEFAQRSRRPEVLITLVDPRHGDRVRIELAAGASRPTIIPLSTSGDAPANSGDGSLDLDAAGRSTQAW